jgi:hypothetical protein
MNFPPAGKLFWCEFCNDSFPVDHFDDVTSYHKVGPEYGPEGLALWKLKNMRQLAAELDVPDWRAALLAILDA